MATERSGYGKLNAAKGALEYIEEGMVVGLGTGSTAKEFIKLFSEKIKKGFDATCVASSLDTERFDRQLGINITAFNDVEHVDVAVDGADVATKNALLKGGGGALTREKIIGYSAKKFIVIVDETKMRKELSGTVVVEVVPFAYASVLRALKKYSKKPKLRLDEHQSLKISDNGNYLIDLPMVVKNPKKTEKELNNVPGVVENGIFTKFWGIVVGNLDGWKKI